MRRWAIRRCTTPMRWRSRRHPRRSSRSRIVRDCKRMQQPSGTFQRRIVIGAGLCVAAFALVGLRLADVTLMHGVNRGSVADRAVLPRADLTDRNGELLARDLPVKDLYARPHVFW